MTKIQKYVIKSPSGMFVTSFQCGCVHVSDKILHGHLYTREQAKLTFKGRKMKGYTLVEYPFIVL